jgi:hypothetical protein
VIGALVFRFKIGGGFLNASIELMTIDPAQLADMV